MFLFSNQQWSLLTAELVVVVLGILIAFQVEEWREQRQVQRDIDAALIRLKDETRANLSTCAVSVPMAERQSRLVQTVVETLQSGRLEDAERAAFEAGLVKLHWLAYPPYRQTVAQEMLSTGLLKSIQEHDLRTIIAGLPPFYEGVLVAFQQQRTNARRAKEMIDLLVTFRYDGSFDHARETEGLRGGMQTFEDATSVEYDLEALVADTSFVNLAIRAANDQIRNYGTNTRLCHLFADIDAVLAKYGYE